VADERGFYFRTSSLWQYLQWLRMGEARPPYFPLHVFAATGYRLHESGAACQVNWNVGMTGYWAGTDTIIIDPYALTDPFLARLPAVRASRVGHYARRIPEGYVAAVCGRPAAIKDARLHAFHERLSLVTQGPLFAPGRLRTILALNLGAYDFYLRDAWQDPYAAPTPRVIEPSPAGEATPLPTGSRPTR
jgi:arabinofuranosyltransferase